MARGGRDGSGRPALNEVHPNNEPPQSTLAAQLVNKITNDNKRLRNQDDETFKQLLREVLDNESEMTSTAITGENGFDVNYKLIYVIVKAGLHTLTQDDPFNHRGEKTRQAVESLRAIQVTLRRNPTLLFLTPTRNDNGSHQDVPLLLWLMPKLLVLLEADIHPDIGKAAEKLLDSALLVEKKTHIKGIRTRTLLRYLQAWVGGLSEQYQKEKFSF